MIIKLNIDGIDYQCSPINPSGLLLVPFAVTPTLVKLDALPWTGVHDAATSGSATGTSGGERDKRESERGTKRE